MPGASLIGKKSFRAAPAQGCIRSATVQTPSPKQNKIHIDNKDALIFSLKNFFGAQPLNRIFIFKWLNRVCL
jgi:hypothetical protein